MVAILCRFCETSKLVKDGFTRGGKQRFLCRGCSRLSVQDPYQGVTAEQEADVLTLLNARMSQRAIARALKMLVVVLI